MVTYQIKDWIANFENAESRKVRDLRWVPMPNKHDGKSYRRIAQHEHAVELFCAWCLIVEVASKMPVRGTLADEDGPLTADDLACMTGFPARIFQLAFKELSRKPLMWLETAEGTPTCDGATPESESPPAQAFPPDPSLQPPYNSVKPPQNRADPEEPGPHPETSGRSGAEGKGREGKEDKRAAHVSTETADAASVAVLTFPTVRGRRGGGETWALTQGTLAEMGTCYPDMDVLAECRNALGWVLGDTKHRKTADGMRRFLFSWLGRAQNRGTYARGSNGARSRPASLPAGREDY